MMPGRRFTLLDAMILVGASAVGIALTRGSVALVESVLGALGLVTEVGRIDLAYAWTWASIPILTTWTLTDLILRSRPPRTSWRRMARQPGAAASGASALALVFLVGSFAASWALYRVTGSRFFFPGALEILSLTVLLVRRLEIVGFSVLVAWSLLVACRLWRAEPNWLDRSGRALGACWIGLALILSVFWQPHF